MMENKVVLKGAPQQVSEYIELPDMGELLLYPAFFDASADDIRKYGTDLQRYLLDKCNLTHSKKVVSVLSEVRLLAPNIRSCTGINNDGWEWHIDCEEEERQVYHESRDIVHLFTNNVTSLTEFNAEEMILDFDPTRPYLEFNHYLRDNIIITPKSMEANKITTFTNHLHRAANPTRPEFKFMFRVVETDRERPTPPYESRPTMIFDGRRGGYINHITRTRGRITIDLPTIHHENYWKAPNK